MTPVSSHTTLTSSTTEPGPLPSTAALAAAFLTIALASFGGGLSAWAQRVLVERRRWLDQDECLQRVVRPNPPCFVASSRPCARRSQRRLDRLAELSGLKVAA